MNPTSTSWCAGTSAGVLAFLLMFDARSARGETIVAAELDYATPVNSDADSGAGFGLRLGQQFRLPPLLTLTPELAYTYHDFSPVPVAYRGVAGVRIAVGEVLRPGAFAHLGIARLIHASPAPSVTEFSFDGGAFLELTLLPFVDFGAHAAYNRVEPSGTAAGFAWLSFGLHIAFVL